MGRVNEGDFSTARPKIEPDDLDGTSAVLECDGYGEEDFDDPSAPGGVRKSAYLTFVEFPAEGDADMGRVCWLNVTSIRAIIQHYGDESDDWIGQLIPVEEVKGTAFKKAYHKVSVVSPPEKWGDFIEGLEPAPTPKRTKRTVKKKSKRGKRAK